MAVSGCVLLYSSQIFDIVVPLGGNAGVCDVRVVCKTFLEKGIMY